MKMLGNFKQIRLWRYGWHVLFAFLAIAAIVSAVIGYTSDGYIRRLSRTIVWVSFFIAFFAFLLSIRQTVRSIKEGGDKIDNVVDMISRNNNLLSQIAQASKLSDSAKSIAFRDVERMELAESVISKLHQHEFEATFAMIGAMERQTEYRTLAVQLRKTAEGYKNATEKERINQATTHIVKLAQEYRWTQAYRQANDLIKGYPYSEKAKAVRVKLKQIKDSRKKELLALWDEAVQSKDTDRSLEILKDLDLYLTQNEALALQDAASTVFKTKLHNMGVRFALAVTEGRWSEALEAGQQIMRDFPNSRMSHEIRGKLDVLQERAKQPEANPNDNPNDK